MPFLLLENFTSHAGGGMWMCVWGGGDKGDDCDEVSTKRPTASQVRRQSIKIRRRKFEWKISCCIFNRFPNISYTAHIWNNVVSCLIKEWRIFLLCFPFAPNLGKQSLLPGRNNLSGYKWHAWFYYEIYSSSFSNLALLPPSEVWRESEKRFLCQSLTSLLLEN